MSSVSPFSMKTSRYAAITAACLTFVETALIIAYAVQVNMEEEECDFDDIRQLDNTCLNHFWDRQNRYRFLQFGFEVIGSLAALASIPPILSLADMYGARVNATKVFVPCAVGAAAISAWGLLNAAGRSTTADWIYSSWTLDADSLKALTVAYFVQRGSNTWLFALDELLIGIALLTIACLTYSVGQLPRWMAHLTVVTGALGIINFFLELSRFGSWNLLSIVSGIVAGFIGFVLLPIFYLGLGCYLKEPSNSAARESLMAEDWTGAGETTAADAPGLELSAVDVETQEETDEAV